MILTLNDGFLDYSDTAKKHTQIDLCEPVARGREAKKAFRSFKDLIAGIDSEAQLNTIKMIHGMRKCQVSGTVMYLCSWEQDLIQNFYSPSWVLSQLITEKRHIADFFEFFAMKMELVQKD